MNDVQLAYCIATVLGIGMGYLLRCYIADVKEAKEARHRRIVRAISKNREA